MKISICIPQYNRIAFLLKSLQLIAQQRYDNLEIVVSDDCSTDDTEQQIKALQGNYRYPIIYYRNPKNLGYDANYRQCIQLATGDYCFVIGNDDSINEPGDMDYLANFLQKNQYPEIGFCNYVEDHDRNTVISRANATAVLGTGYEVALKNYSCFSFVGGLIYKKDAFEKFNTSKHDGSIYAQMYLGSLMIASGQRLFSIEKPLVIKDLVGDESIRKSYREVIAKKWKDHKVVEGGLPSVMNVLISAFRDAGVLTQPIIYKIFRRMYTITYPYWLMNYRSLGALPEAVGLMRGLRPGRHKNFRLLNFGNRQLIRFYYGLYSAVGLLAPLVFYRKFKDRLYKFFKKQG
jgi:glycosyltransferase involved in cell wall biosynthesis